MESSQAPRPKPEKPPKSPRHSSDGYDWWQSINSPSFTPPQVSRGRQVFLEFSLMNEVMGQLSAIKAILRSSFDKTCDYWSVKELEAGKNMFFTIPLEKMSGRSF